MYGLLFTALHRQPRSASLLLIDKALVASLTLTSTIGTFVFVALNAFQIAQLK